MAAIPKIPTLDDVARVAGVSTATVSRCLNTSEKVTQSSRLKVMQAVDMLGYTPHFGARAMAAKRTLTIGAIIPTMESAIFGRGLQAFQENLHAKGYTLLVSSSAYRPETEAEQIKTLVARGADGLLLIGYEREKAVYDFLERREIPTLIAWASIPSNPQTSIGFDNRKSMSALADQVISMGHKNIAVISGVIEGNDRAADRLNGIKDSLAQNNLAPNDVSIVETTYEIESGANAFRELMQTPNRPTVVMCGNDVLAVGAMQCAKDMGLRVPEDVSITGFDDIELARVVTPQLTTVHVPHREMGERAADELVEMVEKRSLGVSTQLQSSLRLRPSLREIK